MDFLIDLCQQYAALFVSICALFLTINQSMATRRHNRLTVKPHLTSFTERVADSERNGIVLVKATLSNNGLGPAIIKSFEPLFDGLSIKASDPDELAEFVQKTLPVSILRDECYFSVLRKDYVLAKDQKITVAQLSVLPTIDVSYEALKASLDQFHLRVTYESAYGESFTYDSRDHRKDEQKGEKIFQQASETAF